MENRTISGLIKASQDASNCNVQNLLFTMTSDKRMLVNGSENFVRPLCENKELLNSVKTLMTSNIKEDGEIRGASFEQNIL